MLPFFPSPWLRDDHQALADAAARLFAERWVPQSAAWRAAGRVPREVWREAGALPDAVASPRSTINWQVQGPAHALLEPARCSYPR